MTEIAKKQSHAQFFAGTILYSGTGALLDFAGWDEPGTLRVLANAIQRLGGRRKGSAPVRLQHQNIQDVSRMYNPRTRPLDNTALALTNLSQLPNAKRHHTQDCQGATTEGPAH